MTTDIRVAVVDDHHVTRQGIISILQKNSRVVIVGEGEVGADINQLMRDHELDVLITDLQMPAVRDENQRDILFKPIEVLKELIQRHPSLKIIVISQKDDVHLINFLAQIGISGYMLKSDDFTRELDRAIEIIVMGGSYFSPQVKQVIFSKQLKRQKQLTNRQLEVLQVISAEPELSRQSVAEALGISPSTLQKHITAIFEALNVSNMTACLLKAMRMQLI